MATSKKTEVAVAASQEVGFATEAPAWMNQGSARGSEEVGANDMVLPRLEIVQALSPIKETNEAAREGLMFNSVTSELLGDTVYFVPVYFRVEYLIWKDQKKGGGFFGSFSSMADAEDRLSEAVSDGENPDDLEIVDTPVQYGLCVTPDGSVCEQIVISMPKTKAKVSRRWNAMIQIAGGDRFSRVYKLTTFTDQNKEGQKFKNFVVQPAGFTPEKIYRQAEALYEILKTQQVRAAHESVVEGEATPLSEGAGGRGEI